MGAFLTLIGLISPAAIRTLLEGVLAHFARRADTELAGFKAGSEADTARLKAFLETQLELNRLKAAQQAWWGARLIVMLAGLPAALHFAAVMLDSLPLLGHEAGSWAIPRLPAPYDGYQWAIVQSFFLVMPAMPAVGALAAWLGRR